MPILDTFLDIIYFSRYCLKYLFNLRCCSYCMSGGSWQIIFLSGSAIAVANLFDLNSFLRCALRVQIILVMIYMRWFTSQHNELSVSILSQQTFVCLYVIIIICCSCCCSCCCCCWSYCYCCCCCCSSNIWKHSLSVLFSWGSFWYFSFVSQIILLYYPIVNHPLSSIPILSKSSLKSTTTLSISFIKLKSKLNKGNFFQRLWISQVLLFHLKMKSWCESVYCKTYAYPLGHILN